MDTTREALDHVFGDRRPMRIVLESSTNSEWVAQPGALVFGNRHGGPFGESKLLRKVLQPAAKVAGPGRVTWHQSRHIHSSLLDNLEVPVKIAQEQLGHASITTTLNIHTHVVDASHRQAVEAVEHRLFGESDANGRELPPAADPTIPTTDNVH